MKNANSRPVWFRRKIGNCVSAWLGLLLVLVIVLAGSLIFVGPLSMATPSGTAENVEARPLSRATSTITATAGPHGTISPAGTVTVNYRANQAFSITPDTGYHITDVVVDGSSVGSVTKYTFKKVVVDHTIAAIFAIDTCTITASADSNGSISPSGAVTVDYGAEQTFAVTPAAGCQVADVLVDGGSVGAVTSYTFSNCTGDHTIAASFVPGTSATCTITAGAGAHGVVSPSGAVTVNQGSNQAFTITPDNGYHVADVLVDGTSVGALTSYTFYSVTVNHTIAVSFALDAGITVVAAHDSPHPADASYVCDGLDDQVEIQAAINALGGSAGRVLLLEGTYYIGSTILAYQNLTLEGSGYGTLLYLADNSNCDVIGNSGGYTNRKANVTIRHLRIDGNKANQSGGNGICRSGDYAIYENLCVESCFKRGISHNKGNYTRIANNIISDCTGIGIFLGESNWCEVCDNIVYECGLVQASTEDEAISIYGGGDNKINRNYVEGGGSNKQIGAWDSPRVEIIGNTLVDGMWMGIAPHSQYARIIGNTVTNAGNNAIDTCGEDDNLIDGNTISHVDKIPLGGAGQENSGICVNGDRTIVINNYIEFAGRAGIHVGSHNDTQILNNVIRNCGQQGAGVAGIWIQIWLTDGINSGTIIRGNTIFDDQAVKTQKYGVWLDPKYGYIDNVVIEGNDLRGNGTAGISPYDPAKVRNPTIQDNQL